MDSRRLAYLRALEIDVWERRDLPRIEPEPLRAEAAQVVAHERAIEPAPTRTIEPVRAASAAKAHDVAGIGLGHAAELGWEALEQAVRGCTRCPLHQSRTQGVFGVGDRKATWLVIGEAPGADEDRQGEPFVG